MGISLRVVGDVGRLYLPYCLEAVQGHGHVVLNRNYKPVGVVSAERVDYAPFAVQLVGLTATAAKKLSCKGLADLERIWLYDDDSVPTDSAANWRTYETRLALLAKLKVKAEW